MSSIVVALLMVMGAGFTLIAAIGLVRFPDLPTRMHAAAKAGTLGCGLLLLGIGGAFGDLGAWMRVLGACLFLLLTAPVAAQVLVRAALGPTDWKDKSC